MYGKGHANRLCTRFRFGVVEDIALLDWDALGVPANMLEFADQHVDFCTSHVLRGVSPA
jgi:hypothetical protein